MEEYWPELNNDSSQLQDVLATTFQETIDAFGTPRGGLIDPEDPDSYEVELEETPGQTPEEEAAAILEGKDYGKIVKYDDGSFRAEVSDDEFTDDIARQLRIGNRANG